jgi:predicted dehydrogenase
VQPFLPYREPLYMELEHFTQAVINDTEPTITGRDGLRALQICEAALESSRTGQTVKLEPIT